MHLKFSDIVYLQNKRQPAKIYIIQLLLESIKHVFMWIYLVLIFFVDDRARDRDSVGQDDGPVPFPAGEGCVWEVLQATPR